jgi:hypothetical protein
LPALAAVRLRGDSIINCTPLPFALAFDRSCGTLHIVKQGELTSEMTRSSTPSPGDHAPALAHTVAVARRALSASMLRRRRRSLDP